MGVLQYIYAPATAPTAEQEVDEAEGSTLDVSAAPAAPASANALTAEQDVDKAEGSATLGISAAAEQSTEPTSHNTSSDAHSALSQTADEAIPAPESTPATSVHNTPTRSKPGHGFSFRALAFLSNHSEVKHAQSTVHEPTTPSPTTGGFFRRQTKVSGADRRAQKSALAVRSLIVGPLSAPPSSPGGKKAFSKLDLSKAKSQLLDPKSASKLIAQLRALPTFEGDESKAAGPIHAVCLDNTDADAEERHFSRLVQRRSSAVEAESSTIPSVVTASLAEITSMLKDMHVVNLITATDFGLGQPGDGSGILSGAVPTAETVINGIRMLTPELMALGYATGKAALPDHTGVYPPTDRMSVLTYWWGLELVLPSSSLHYLASTKSITHSIINFLTVLSALDSGVREILPFVRYIGQYVDFEFTSIQKQDRGEGVVCAATWIMPAALVPRPWDFVAPPKPTTPAGDPFAGPVTRLPRPSQATEASTRPSESPSDMTSPMTPVPSLPPILPEFVISSPNGTSSTNLIGM